MAMDDILAKYGPKKTSKTKTKKSKGKHSKRKKAKKLKYNAPVLVDEDEIARYDANPSTERTQEEEEAIVKIARDRREQYNLTTGPRRQYQDGSGWATVDDTVKKERNVEGPPGIAPPPGVDLPPGIVRQSTGPAPRRRRRHDSDADDDSDSDSDMDVRRAPPRTESTRQRHDSDNDGGDSDSDLDVRRRPGMKTRSSEAASRRRHDSDADDGSDSDLDVRRRPAPQQASNDSKPTRQRHDSDEDSDSDLDMVRSARGTKRSRHDSDDDDGATAGSHKRRRGRDSDLAAAMVEAEGEVLTSAKNAHLARYISKSKIPIRARDSSRSPDAAPARRTRHDSDNESDSDSDDSDSDLEVKRPRKPAGSANSGVKREPRSPGGVKRDRTNAEKRATKKSDPYGTSKKSKPSAAPPGLIDNDELGMVWGKGYVQDKDRKEAKKRLKKEAKKKFSRSVDDTELNQYQKQQDRWGDPMLASIKEKSAKQLKAERIVRENLRAAEEDESDEGGGGGGDAKKRRRRVVRRKERPRCMSRFPNRYGIAPGHRWDGVDRSNGWEERRVVIMNERKSLSKEAYKWSSQVM